MPLDYEPRNNRLLSQLGLKLLQAQNDDYAQLQPLRSPSERKKLNLSRASKLRRAFSCEEYNVMHVFFSHFDDLPGKDFRWVHGMLSCNLNLCSETADIILSSLANEFDVRMDDFTTLAKRISRELIR